MRLIRIAAVSAALSLAAASTAQTPAPQFTPAAFRAHVEFLADDRLQGREAGTLGYDIAADYVARRFQELGLTPAVNGAWYQQVPFVEYRMGAGPARVTIGGKSFANMEAVLIAAEPTAGANRIEAPVVFVGHGLDLPEHGIRDYAGLDVRGKIVAVLSGTPNGLPSDLAAHFSSEKAKMAARHGAIGTLSIRTRESAQKMPWGRLRTYAGQPGMTWIAPDGRPHTSAAGIQGAATLDTAAAEALFAGAPRSLAQVLDAAATGKSVKGFPLKARAEIASETAVRRFTSPNVLAMLPGSDPALANEYVLLMAHLDHIGVSEEAQGDKINNGALDNASGVATMIEAARAFVQSGQRPRRPILFAAVTAEETGLLGAQYLAKNPVLPGGGKVVGVVNLDMPVLLYDFNDVIAFGAEHSTLGPVVARAGATMGVRLAQDPLPQEGLFTRSDHYRFVQEGVPSVFLMTGFGNGGEARFTDFLRRHYHKPSDQLDLPIDWNAGAKFARLNYLIAREIADAPQAPRWYGDSFFGKAFGAGQPTAAR